MAHTEPPTADDYARLEASRDRLLAWAWQQCMMTAPGGFPFCAECGAEAYHSKADVVHRPGCVLHGLAPETLRALAGFEIKPGEAL